MELVSANTKNYLFLTLTQNNESEELVRARVSMRRDQAFWEGGNSFIACESFRITSAPNEGGLYYQEVPTDFVMGSVTDQGSSGGDTFGQLSSLMIPPGNLTGPGVARQADKLRALNVDLNKDTKAVSATLQLSAHNNAYLTESRLEDLVPRLAKYLPKMKLGSKLRFTDQAQPQVSMNFRVTEDPKHGLRGPSTGSNGLFVPDISFPNAGNDFGKFADANNSTVGFASGVTVQFNIPQGGVNPDFNAFVNNCRQLVSNAPYIHFSGGVAGVHASPYANGAICQIMQPRGLFGNIPGMNNQHGETKFPVTWSTIPLKVGDTIMSGGKTGSCTSPGDQPQNITADGFMWQLDLKYTPAFATALGNAPGLFSQQIMSNNKYCVVIYDERLASLGYNISLKGECVDLQPPDINATCNIVSAATDATSHLVTVTRTGSGDKVYTPNELFYMFNKGTNPWTLQTDENGGFTVQWSSAQTPVDKFYISKPMCDSLGLNAWMDFTNTGDTRTTQYTAILLDPGYREVEEEDTVAFSTWLVEAPLTEVTKYADGTAIIPAGNNANWSNMLAVTWHGKLYYLLDIKDLSSDTSADYPSRLLPQLLTINGIETYQYSGLPKTGQIGNTGQISVESWGTFSMINLVIPNIPFQSMLGGESDSRILASLRLPFDYGTDNGPSGAVKTTDFSYYGDLLYNSDSSRSYLRITTDQQLFDCDVEARLIRRGGAMEVMQIPYKGQFQVKLRLLQTQ